MASPMYEAFTAEPLNSDPVDAVSAKVDMSSRNTTASPWAAQSSRLALGEVDRVSQRDLDAVLWKSVYGANSTPPPPGPNAENEAGEER
jgi:hypothetical protein